MRIETIQYHREQIAKIQAEQTARLDKDVSDVALSTWAGDSMIRAHYAAINALELGAEHGINGPAGEFPCLMQNLGRIVNAKLVDGQFGKVWLLSEVESSLFGRKFIPFGKNSRIQKQLGLWESTQILPAKRELGASSANYLGAFVSFFPVKEEK